MGVELVKRQRSHRRERLTSFLQSADLDTPFAAHSGVLVWVKRWSWCDRAGGVGGGER